jgi:hypothetical protein
MTAQVFTPSVATTVLPKTNLLETFVARFTSRNSKGRIYRHDGTTSVTVTTY